MSGPRLESLSDDERLAKALSVLRQHRILHVGGEGSQIDDGLTFELHEDGGLRVLVQQTAGEKLFKMALTVDALGQWRITHWEQR